MIPANLFFGKSAEDGRPEESEGREGRPYDSYTAGRERAASSPPNSGPVPERAQQHPYRNWLLVQGGAARKDTVVEIPQPTRDAHRTMISQPGVGKVPNRPPAIGTCSVPRRRRAVPR